MRFRAGGFLLILLGGLGGLALIGLWPGVREGVVATGRVLTAGDLAGVREYLRSYGAWGPVAAFLLIQLQAVFAPLPSFPVVYAAGFLFGTFWGGLLSWVSVLVSAALCFGLARGFGRPLVECVVSPRALRRADALFLRHGTFAVLLARLLPFTAFDLLSFAAGLTPMGLGPFLVATAIGMTPSIFLMAWAGDLGGCSVQAFVGWSVGLALLAAAAAWLGGRVRARLGLGAPAAEPEG